MQNYVVETIGMDVPALRVFDYVRDASKLPEWTNAFREVSDGSARMETPRGAVSVGLEVHASRAGHTVDWKMKFPGGDESWAWSRVVQAGPRQSVYTFVLPAPPDALEGIEGGLEEQAGALRQELERLKGVLEAR